MIYVDPMRRNARSWGYYRQYTSSCHLFTDGDLEELHVFAHRIGLRREWFQNHRLLSHYDLTSGRRRKAIEAGAKEVSHSEFQDMIRKIMGKRLGSWSLDRTRSDP